MSNKLKKRRKWGITCHLRCFWGRRPGLISWKKLSVIIRILHLLRIFKRCKKKTKKNKKCLPLKVSHIINFKWYIGRQFFFTDLSNCARLKITPSSIIAFSFNYVRKNADFPTDVDQPSRLVASFPVHGIKYFCYYEISIFRGEFLGYSVSWRAVESWVYSVSSPHKPWKPFKIK